ncbi:putative craniofacial development protein [Trypoxylus dichotomus]
MNSLEYPDDSDSSDEDYIPESVPADVVSEVDSEGDVEDPLSDKEELGARSCSKRKKKTLKSRKKLKKEGVNGKDSNEITPEKPEPTEEEKKKQEEDLWASFKKETNFKARPTNVQTSKNDTKENDNIEQKKAPEKVKITEIFEFAGEEVKVEKEVPVNSPVAKLSHIPSGSDPPNRGKSRGSGLGSLLNQIGKKKKINTLEKSKLDWEKFKKEENLEDEITTFNKGKDGYLDRQDFLQRTDLRRFEIERDVRNTERNKRLNNL